MKLHLLAACSSLCYQRYLGLKADEPLSRDSAPLITQRVLNTDSFYQVSTRYWRYAPKELHYRYY